MASLAKPPKLKLTYSDPSEDQFQISVVNLLDAILPVDQATYTHIPVGGYELSPAARARLYRLGLKRGWPDLCIAYSLRRILWLELKTHKGVLSSDQKTRHAQLRAFGHNVVVCRKIEDVLQALVLYGVPFRRNSLAENYHATIDTCDAPGRTPELTQG